MVVGLVSAGVLLLPAAATEAAFPGANGKIAFTTVRQDANAEIHTILPEGGVSTNLTQNPASDHDPAWSSDGSRIAFTSDRDGDNEIYVMDADGGNATRLTTDAADDDSAAWSPDGTRIVFSRGIVGTARRNLYIANADGSGEVALTTDTNVVDDMPAWSPDGGSIAFVRRRLNNGLQDIHTVRPDGMDDTQLTHTGVWEFNPNWSPDGELIVFSREFSGLLTMRPNGSGEQALPFSSPYVSPAWSPEGSDIVVADLSDSSDFEITMISEIGTQPRRLTENSFDDHRPDWQPLPPAPPIPGYPRPKGASPIRVSLVPAFKPCSGPNAQHGPPLAFPSCSPPQQTSSYLTVGTPDANGEAARSVGSVRMGVVQAPESDVRWTASLTDVRCIAAGFACTAGALSDYVGELQVTSSIRVTDRFNGHTQDRPGTLDRFEFPTTVQCQATAAAEIGGFCSIATSFNAVLPGAVQDGKRAVWELGQVQVRDGGADGSAFSDDYTVLAVQGVFVP